MQNSGGQGDCLPDAKISYYQQQPEGVWESVADIAETLVHNSRMMDADGSQRAIVPPIPIPAEKAPEGLFTSFNDRHTNDIGMVRGRGRMMEELARNCSLEYQSQLIERDLRSAEHLGFGCDETAFERFISLARDQFADALVAGPEEPSFGKKSLTSISLTSEKMNSSNFTASSPLPYNVQEELQFGGSPQGASGPSDIYKRSHSPDLATLYTIDDSIFVKVEAPSPVVEPFVTVTASPCSSPLPHHITVEDTYNGTESSLVESDDYSGQTEAHSADVISYFNEVIRDFESQPGIYEELVSIFTEWKNGQLDLTTMMLRVTQLFGPYPDARTRLKQLLVRTSDVSFITPTLISAPKRVARLSDSTKPRRCRNALILNLLKKEADVLAKIPVTVGDGKVQCNNEEIKTQELTNNVIIPNDSVNITEETIGNTDELECYQLTICDETGSSYCVRDSVLEGNGQEALGDSIGIMKTLSDDGANPSPADDSTQLQRLSGNPEDLATSTNDLGELEHGLNSAASHTLTFGSNLTVRKFPKERESAASSLTFQEVSSLNLMDDSHDDINHEFEVSSSDTFVRDSIPSSSSVADQHFELLKPEDIIIPDMSERVGPRNVEIPEELILDIAQSALIRMGIGGPERDNVINTFKDIPIAFDDSAQTEFDDSVLDLDLELLKPTDFVQLDGSTLDAAGVSSMHSSPSQAPERGLPSEENALSMLEEVSSSTGDSCDVDSASGSVRGIIHERLLETKSVDENEDLVTVTAAFSKIDLNSDLAGSSANDVSGLDNVLMDNETTFGTAPIIGRGEPAAASEITTTTITVHTLTTDQIQSSVANHECIRVVPQGAAIDSASILLRPDQFVT